MLAIFRILLGVGFGLNALAMIVSPQFWYDTLPGVAERGAFNGHFIRDIGCAFLVVAGSFIAAEASPQRWWPALAVSTGLVALHALVHLGEAAAGVGPGWAGAAVDMPSVYLPAALSLWLTLIHPGRKAMR